MKYDEIRKEIERLEGAETTYSTCERLAVLYVVADHLKRSGASERVTYSHAAEPKTELRAALGEVPTEAAWDVLEEHFEAIEILYPKEYRKVIERLNRAKENPD